MGILLAAAIGCERPMPTGSFVLSAPESFSCGLLAARWDTDGDGGWSLAELTAGAAAAGPRHPVELAEVFRRLDANADGRADAAEIAAGCALASAVGRHVPAADPTPDPTELACQERFEAHDRDGEAGLSAAEFATLWQTPSPAPGAAEPLPPAAWFARVDANGDGRVQAWEYCGFDPAALAPSPLAPAAEGGCDAALARLDADGSGAIALGEFLTGWDFTRGGAPADRFAVADLDGNGELSRGELCLAEDGPDASPRPSPSPSPRPTLGPGEAVLSPRPAR